MKTLGFKKREVSRGVIADLFVLVVPSKEDMGGMPRWGI